MIATGTTFRIPLTRPAIGAEEIEAVTRALRSGWVTQGPEVAAFEREFAAWVGAPYACAVSSGTTALHLALLAVGVGPGREVVTVSHSFVATANAVRYCGAIPVFVDIDAPTFNIDPALIEAALSPRTAAILCVHQMGLPCDLGAILEIAQRRGLPVVEDAACAVGAEILRHGGWERIGRPHGTVACFSFHPRKLLTTGEGGMLTTRDPDLDRQVRLWRQHGMSVSDLARHGAQEVTFESYVGLGYNYRMTDLQAALGRAQLARLGEVIAARRRLAARYHALLEAVPEVAAPTEPGWARSNWQSFCIRLPRGVGQRRVMQAMLEAGVATRRGIMCAHREPAYAAEPWSCGGCVAPNGCPPRSCQRLRASEQAQDSTILLPLYHGMTAVEQARVIDALSVACASKLDEGPHL